MKKRWSYESIKRKEVWIEKRYDGSNVKVRGDSGLKGPGFELQQRQENVKNIFSCFCLVAMQAMRSTSKQMPYFLHTCYNK